MIVELMSGPCSVVCDGTPNICRTNVTTIIWTNPDEIMIMDGLSPLFYCARIMTVSECCAICSTTVEINKTERRLDSYFVTDTTYWPYFSCMIIVIGGVLVGSILWIKGQHNSENKSSGLTINDVLSKPILKRNDTDSVQILLLYPRKNHSFMCVMNSFRKVLEMYVDKVWDPLDSRQVENVCENPFKWLQNVLLIPNLKIINVEDVSDDPSPTAEDVFNTYTFAMSMIQNSLEISYNYTKLFYVRFAYQPIKLTDRVPNTRYELPQHLGDLICDILNISQIERQSGSCTGGEILEFKNRLKDYTELINT